MHLSNQALGAIMLALQESLMTQTDIVPILKGFELESAGEEGLIVTNPPTIRVSNDEAVSEDELKEMVRNIVEELCAKGKAYRKKRMAAGEKSSAYLSGRAVKVCKGQIKGEAEDAAMKKSALGMAMYGKKAKMNEQDSLEVDVYGYQTKHFDVCPGAQSLYKRIVDEDYIKGKSFETYTKDVKNIRG